MIRLILVLVLSVFIMACTREMAVPQGIPIPPNGNPQIANPASVNCVNNGGTLQIREETDGQVGYCTLKDGTVCEEWKYYRKECP